ncbi:hypothetical protein RhiirA5_436186 [Rhizophagus irregularis]|uniref:Uncharacterized protein n=1 Tax=Rhizophagus irregularis TaxID=588596 RepID=A0A2N0NM95_9GLOM|nr:hypothetical protein RhiirA5_436186 [Rhizophagus irregularis]
MLIRFNYQIGSLQIEIDNNNILKPDNSDDFYKKNDMISIVSLQIDISRLNISKDDQNGKSIGKEKI